MARSLKLLSRDNDEKGRKKQNKKKQERKKERRKGCRKKERKKRMKKEGKKEGKKERTRYISPVDFATTKLKLEFFIAANKSEKFSSFFLSFFPYFLSFLPFLSFFLFPSSVKEEDKEKRNIGKRESHKFANILLLFLLLLLFSIVHQFYGIFFLSPSARSLARSLAATL